MEKEVDTEWLVGKLEEMARLFWGETRVNTIDCLCKMLFLTIIQPNDDGTGMSIAEQKEYYAKTIMFLDHLGEEHFKEVMQNGH